MNFTSKIRFAVTGCLGILITGLSTQQKAFGQQKVVNGRVTITLQEYKLAFRNPMMGLREFFSPGIDKKRAEYPYPYGSLTKEYMQWNMIEDKPGDGVDKIIAYSNHRWAGVEDINMKVIPRVYLVWVEPWHGGKPKDTTNKDDLNGWHWPAGIAGESGPYKQRSNSQGAMVDAANQDTPIQGGYFDPAFPDRVKALVKKLGQAWDNDPRVAYVEMGIIGEWGEQHDPDLSTYWAPHDEPKHVLNRTWIDGMQKVLGDAFADAFKHKKVMVRYAYEFKDYDFGIYWDSWAQKDEKVRGYDEMKKLGNRWKTQPIGGEITWNWGSMAKFKSFEDVVADPEFFDITMEHIRNLHCNHLGGITWANFNDPVFKKNAGKLQQALGYRYVLSDVSYPVNIQPGKPFRVTFNVTNTGSSPFYYNWPVQVMLLDAVTHKRVWTQTLEGVKISDWMPGDNWSIKQRSYTTKPQVYHIDKQLPGADIPAGKYIIALSVADPAGMQPSIRFANKNYFNGGYHPVGYIGVNKKLDAFVIENSLFADIENDKSLKYSTK